MKTSVSIGLIIVLLLCAVPRSLAQNATDCVKLLDSINKLERVVEKLPFKSMSPSIQQVYRESLLKLYSQFSQCIGRDIAAASEMQRAVAGTDAAASVDDKLRALIKQRDENNAKITIIKTSLNLSADSPTSEVGMGPPTPSAMDVSAGSRDVPTSTEMMTTTTTIPTVTRAQAAFTCAPVAAYDDAPVLLKDIVDRAAEDVVSNNDVDRVSAAVSIMLLYTVIDAASPSSSKLLRSLEAYQYLGETARTDKQLGASAKSEGAVSAIEKPGFARLLGFAIEHGGINQKTDGTNLTLSTSLYSLYAMNGGDTAETYDRAGVFNRIGISASFALANKDDELSNARRQNLSEWSAKARLFGDRSTRSAIFQRFWDEKIRPVISARLLAIGGALKGLSNNSPSNPAFIPGFNDLEDNVDDCLSAKVKARMGDPDYQAATPAARKKILSDLLLGHLRSNVFDRVKDGRLEIPSGAITLIETQYVPNLKAALDNLVTAQGELVKQIDNLKKSPLGTFAYINHRTPMGSDYSETKFLFEQDQSFLRPLKLTGNFGLTFYHRPDPTLQQQKLRDVTAALSFEGSTRSPFTEAENLSKITFSFVGSYQRMLENRRRPNRTPDLASAQFVLEIPFVRGFSIPFSLTYANATEEERKKNVRFNFGMRLDTDKLFDLLRATPDR